MNKLNYFVCNVLYSVNMQSINKLTLEQLYTHDIHNYSQISLILREAFNHITHGKILPDDPTFSVDLQWLCSFELVMVFPTDTDFSQCLPITQDPMAWPINL